MRKAPRIVFDGFCERPYNEETDGWMIGQPENQDYPLIESAKQVLEMYQEICDLRRENWRLRRDLKRWEA